MSLFRLLCILTIGVAVGVVIGSWLQEFAMIMQIENLLIDDPSPQLDQFNVTRPVVHGMRLTALAVAVVAGVGLLLTRRRARRN